MSINFNLYGELANIKADRMSIHNLEVGQKVVRILRPSIHWGTVLGKFETRELVVKKVLKTRVVFETVDGGHELRMLVETAQWTSRQGDVKTDQEGNANSWNREPIELATADEVEIIEAIRKHYENRIAEQEARSKAKQAIAAVRHELDGNPDLAKIDAAIEALTAIRNQMVAAS